jgi:hypothetical protein
MNSLFEILAVVNTSSLMEQSSTSQGLALLNSNLLSNGKASSEVVCLAD